MIIELTSRHGSLSEDLKEHADRKVRQAMKHADDIISAHVVFDAEKERQTAEIVVYGRNLTATVHAESSDAWASIDRAAEKLRHQLEKHHSKRRSRRRRGQGHEEATRVELEAIAQAGEEGKEQAAEDEQEQPILRRELPELQELSVDEAREAIDSAADGVLLFRGSGSGRVSVLYRRHDGGLSLIEAGAA